MKVIACAASCTCVYTAADNNWCIFIISKLLLCPPLKWRNVLSQVVGLSCGLLCLNWDYPRVLCGTVSWGLGIHRGMVSLIDTLFAKVMYKGFRRSSELSRAMCTYVGCIAVFLLQVGVYQYLSSRSPSYPWLATLIPSLSAKKQGRGGGCPMKERPHALVLITQGGSLTAREVSWVRGAGFGRVQSTKQCEKLVN